jgi:uncharacterized nucleotidyltransferase DUF6036
MELNQDFREFFLSLNARGVRYLVVGGFAVALHGHPRYTKDIDVWIDCTAANAKRMVRALADFGFESLGLCASDFQVVDQVIQLGIAPNRIDILMSLKGVNFRRCYPQRVMADFEGVVVNFIDIESLKVNKRSTGRVQDQADAESLDARDVS